MENLYDKVLSMRKHKLQAEQVLIENNIKIETQDEVARVLAVNCRADLDRPIEALSSECMLSGKIITNLVYVSNNGEINNQSSVSSFSYKLSNEYIENGSKINAVATVVNTEVDKLINNQIKVLSTVNIDAVVIKNEEVKYLKDGESGSYIKQEEKEITSFSEHICEKFEESMEASVKNGVKKVLMTNVDFLLKEWNLGPNFVSIEGEIYAKVVYADKQEISELQTITISKNIKQEIEIQGINKDTDLDVLAIIINEGIVVEINEKGEECEITINVPLMVCLNTYVNNKILAINDIYSCNSELKIQNDNFKNCKNLKPEYIEGKIEGSLSLSEDAPRVDKLLGVGNVKPYISNTFIQDRKLVVEGIACANVIYLNDELGEIQSAEIEIPFVLDKKVDLDGDIVIEPVVSLLDADVMVKRGREIYFDAKAKAFINLTCKNTVNLVTGVEFLGEVEQKEGAIEIYFGTEGETIWDIAKTLKIPSEIIKSQNPDICDPLEKDQNIALYYQKIRN